jgi:hypothetical protein
MLKGFDLFVGIIGEAVTGPNNMRPWRKRHWNI